ncbi:FAD binding domain-containing protein [Tengunoibacter tsumagoiensis]|uniref:Uncharacterized protein n=1 Tax=Tengunoibacter tsumagoiensis TaxID=2014871 RepID=A0A402A127_9CHLR|nr:FAD binding domain-containing protein [Tengunoibacter tsumagoiensis]GCE12847.1 hypothetical protein KTT_27060 [Tengunoibacter tsumagoiensis]
MWDIYCQPTTLFEAISLLDRYGPEARLIAGGTDILLELQRGLRPSSVLIDITRLSELDFIRNEQGVLVLGALTTHNAVLCSTDCQTYAPLLVQACQEVGAPQIRARATLAGNLLTASPANDTIPPLMALDASVVLMSCAGERIVSLRDFYTGVRHTVCRPNELLREIRFPTLSIQQRSLFLKLGLRRAQAISVVNAAFVLLFDGDNRVEKAAITLGSVAPTVIHARRVETFLQGQELNEQVCKEAGAIVAQDIRPISDIRASATYRQQALSSLLAHGLQRLTHPVLPEQKRPVTLETAAKRAHPLPFRRQIETTLNGQPTSWPHASQKTLLNALREDAGLTGTKEGCAEGECGACTVWLGGQAVMSCLVPAVQAHGAEITTIEGLAGEQLHPLQQSFIDHGAVQCGFCIPGMLMAGAKVLDEVQHPTIEQVQVALSGNICRCTGYRKIIEAVLSIGGEA